MSQRATLNRILRKKKRSFDGNLTIEEIRSTLEVKPPSRTTLDGSLLPVKTIYNQNKKPVKIVLNHKDMSNGSYYDPDTYPYITYIVCREGFTNEKLALLFFVDENIINQWKLKYTLFRDAYQKGKDEFDSQLLEETLLQRAKGVETTETTRDKKGEIIKTVSKEYPPDARAIELFLRCRHPDRWNGDREKEQTPVKFKPEEKEKQSPEHVTTVLHILIQAGAVESGLSQVIDTTAEQVHPPQADG